ncbi:hypothetical protein KM043_003615 [Ampulex compressa]|nr:hypothetical protein KM043_003615 [Ampulex compressa]
MRETMFIPPSNLESPFEPQRSFLAAAKPRTRVPNSKEAGHSAGSGSSDGTGLNYRGVFHPGQRGWGGTGSECICIHPPTPPGAANVGINLPLRDLWKYPRKRITPRKRNEGGWRGGRVSFCSLAGENRPGTKWMQPTASRRGSRGGNKKNMLMERKSRIRGRNGSSVLLDELRELRLAFLYKRRGNCLARGAPWKLWM